MKEELKIIRTVLKKEIGWSWFPFLIKCFFKKRSIFNKTHWAQEKTLESKFVKRLSLASAMFLELKEKYGKDKAFEIMKQLLINTGCNEQWNYLKSLELVNKTPMEKLMAFNDLMDKRGAPQFNKQEYIKQNESICHFIIKRCIFKDFFTEAGTPELTSLFCEVDRKFFPKAFPEFEFHRNGSWENTIAYGKSYCEFVFELKEE